MRNLVKFLAASAIVAGVGFGINAVAQQKFLQKGDKAPDFFAPGTDGKTHTLASVTKDGPVFLYFIKIGCPVNHKAAPHVVAVEKAYAEKGNVVGVINGSVEDAKKWASQYGAKFPIIADPDLKIIRSYSAPYSPFMIAVGKDRKVSSVIEGLSAKELQHVNTMVSTSLKAKLIAMDFKGAPSGGG
jgi:peroxiredoxin Q/BCP